MRATALISTTGLVAASLLLAPTVQAGNKAPKSGKPVKAPVVLSTEVGAPFNLAVKGGRVLVADGGPGLVGLLKRDGSIKPIVADAPGAAGVDLAAGRLAFTTTETNYDTFENTASGLHIWSPVKKWSKHKGKFWGHKPGVKKMGVKKVYADTHAYEAARNPDQVNRYGVENPSQCVIDAFTAAEFPYDYTGMVDSHAYSVVRAGGKWIVADAGANTLWKIDDKGRISTLWVVPPQPAKITPEAAEAFGFPDCVAGVTYGFEGVPTDVEVGRDGFLYVTTLPGGPESEVLGARGKVWRVNPHTGKAKEIAGGFLGATNLAIGNRGEIYVAELFGGRISVIKHGKISEYLSLPGVVAVESGRHGGLWAATMGNEDPPAPGTIVKISSGHKGNR
ncbi:MAG: ScyD/ScyE family protein [Nocardioidaceae bacterium]|nr:MAG: ScyD/ScyE family protein [Nocardioidaceae bacterium]